MERAQPGLPDETHIDLGECHFQIDYRGETVQRDETTFLDMYPLNVYDQRMDDLVDTLDELIRENELPRVLKQAVQ